jgi:hypothetical protein
MAERFNGRIGSEVPGISIWFHQQLKQPPRGFNAAYNGRRQRVLDGKTPDQVVAERMKQRRRVADARTQGGQAPGRCQGTHHRRSRQGGLATRQLETPIHGVPACLPRCATLHRLGPPIRLRRFAAHPCTIPGHCPRGMSAPTTRFSRPSSMW